MFSTAVRRGKRSGTTADFSGPPGWPATQTTSPFRRTVEYWRNPHCTRCWSENQWKLFEWAGSRFIRRLLLGPLSVYRKTVGRLILCNIYPVPRTPSDILYVCWRGNGCIVQLDPNHCRLSSDVAEFPSVLSSSNECNTDACVL